MVFTGPIDGTHASLIGGAVLEMALTADRIAADAWKSAPAEGFAAGLYEPDGQPSSALVQASTSIASGVDHLRAYGLLLKREVGLSTSLGTVSRGAVEAFGRAWHILSADTAEEARYRAALLTASEYEMSTSRGLQVKGKHGIPTREEAEAVIREQLAVTPEGEALAQEPNFKKIARMAPGFTAIAVDILAATADVDGSEAYSRLSGVAHAETTHLLPRGIPTGENTAGLIQTYEWVSTTTRYPLDAVRVTIDVVTSEWNRPGDAQKWSQVRTRSFERIGAYLGE